MSHAANRSLETAVGLGSVGAGSRVVWDARLASELSEVTLSAPLGAGIAEAVMDIVRRFGFAIVQSQPAQTTAEAIDARRGELLSFSAAIGKPINQSPRRELVEDIKDFSDIDAHDDRGYRSGGELKPHSDPPTLIVLHCVQAARSGGESSLVSVAAIVEKMRTIDVSLVDELFKPFPDWLIDGQYGRAGAGPSEFPRPVLTKHNETISCVLYRPFIEKAALALGTTTSSKADCSARPVRAVLVRS